MNYYLPNFESDSGKTRDSLPGCKTPLNSPFLGFVVNVNARCNPHRDVGDSSMNITHYNMEVVGGRYSLVCHTDKTIEGYVEHRNHWGHSLN